MEKEDSLSYCKYLIDTHFMVRVVNFYPETQTVDVISDVYEYSYDPVGKYYIQNELGSLVPASIRKPTIFKGIPVKQLRWGQFEIQCCPKKGDTGYIEIFTNDIRDWIVNGSLSIPWSDERFNKQSSVFVPFVPNHKNASTTYPVENDRLIIKSESVKLELIDNDDGTTINAVAETINFTGDFNVEGNIDCTGDITATGDIVAGGVSLKNHTHPVPATGLVAPAGGGAVTGSATSSAPGV